MVKMTDHSPAELSKTSARLSEFSIDVDAIYKINYVRYIKQLRQK